MGFTFALRDKGTNNQGWWLRITSVEELIEYYKQIAPVRNGKAFENYFYGKEWNGYHPGFENDRHAPHHETAAYTDAVVRYAAKNDLNIFNALTEFTQMVALQQLEELKEHGTIYINRVGGYTWKTEKSIEYALVRRDELVFPEFKKNEIRVKRFPYGNHFYAYIGDLQVKDGDQMKWNTYEEAYAQAKKLLCN